MINDANLANRATFIYDAGKGKSIGQDIFASAAVVDYYEKQGFDRNFMVWAPIVSTTAPRERWTYCNGPRVGGLCAGATGEGSQLISDEFRSGAIIHLKQWGASFIGAVCGNWKVGGGVGPTPTVTGVKYEDVNGNHVRDAGEPGLAGWQIQLTYNGTTVASTTTGAGGAYAFSLDANTLPISGGTYAVNEIGQSGWVQSAAPAPFQVDLGAGDATFSGKDFGNYRAPTIAGRKFEDMNADGSGAGDPGLANWRIDYTGPTGGSVTTGADGSYTLAGLVPGTYTIAEETKAGWNQSAPGGPGTRTVTVVSGQTVADQDFGNWRPATIEGRKFDDHGVDGSGAGDPGIASWKILTGGLSALTSSTGGYTFGGLKPGSYTVSEEQRDGWRQTAPTSGTTTVQLVSGQVVKDVDFGNVCMGHVSVTVPAGVQVNLAEVSVPGILTNDPAMPRTATGATTIDSLLPGVYKITMLLPDGVFTTDPDLTALGDSFAIVKTITVAECGTTSVAPVFVVSEPGKITGGVRLDVPGGFATGGFEFMQKKEGPRGTLEFNDHARDIRIHTSDITGISVSGNEAFIFGHVVLDGKTYSFRLHLVDAGEPGTSDVFELQVSNGYTAGMGQLITDGNIQIHK